MTEQALIEAIRDGRDADALARLAAGAAPHCVESHTGMTALAVAVSANRPRVVRALLDAGAAPDVEGPDGTRPLSLATGAERLDVLRLLLDAGADPNHHPVGGPSVLYGSAAHPQAVALLLAHGADPNLATAQGETALSFCASWGLVETARLLLAHQADANHVVSAAADGELAFEWSVLCFAAMEGDLEMAGALLAGGADPTWANRWGKTAASVAADHRHPEALAALLDAQRARGFGQPSGGLRGRLRVGLGARPAVVLDLQNVSEAEVEVEVEDPTRLTWSLHRDGRPIAPAFGRMDVMCSPRRVLLKQGDLVAWTVSRPATPAERGSVDLDLVTSAWRRPADGELRLVGVLQLPQGALALEASL